MRPPPGTYRLNPRLRFFAYRGRRYGYMPAHWHPVCILALNREMERFLQRFDGKTGPEEIVLGSGLEGEAVRLVRDLLDVGVLLSSDPEPIRRPEVQEDSFWLYMTDACNLRCEYCYARGGEVEAKTVSMDHVRAALGHFFGQLPASVQHVHMVLHGGEPTLAFETMKQSWELFKAQAGARGLKHSSSGPTNGVFDRRVLDWVVAERVTFRFSMDGPPGIHNRQRPMIGGGPSWDIVARNITHLVDRGLRPAVRATVTSTSLGRLGDIVRQTRELGLKNLGLEPCRTLGRATGNKDIKPDPDLFAQGFLEAVELGLNLGVNVSNSAAACLFYWKGYSCNAVKPNFALTPGGYISSCPEVSSPEDPAAGTFFYGKVMENGSIQIDEGRRRFLQCRRGGRLSSCGKCFLIDTCAGNCASQALRNHGDYFTKDEAICRFTRSIAAGVISRIADSRIKATYLLQPREIRLGEEDSGNASRPWMRLIALTPSGHPRRRPMLKDRPFVFIDKEKASLLFTMAG